MPDRSDIAYLYDGSYEGFLCCVFESFERREIPPDIFAQDSDRLSLFPARFIATDATRAKRVAVSIPRRISREAADFVYTAHLSCLPSKEILLLAFLRMGYKMGPNVLSALADDTVDTLTKAVRHARGEAHLLSGFLRFSDNDGLLVSLIEPKNQVLPLFADHFANRYQSQPILIYDKTHAQALAAQGGQWRIAPLAGFEPAAPDAKERQVRTLWRAFYDAIAIEGRRNERCRMSHMPKRYWKHMTEFQQEEEVCESMPEGTSRGQEHYIE